MIEFECIPAIDLKSGRCVRLREGRAERAIEYASDPRAMALHWQDQGASRLHLVDLDGAFSGDPTHMTAAASVFRALRIPVQFGGGLRTLDRIAQVLDAGADRAIIGTAAVEDPRLVAEACRRWPGRVVVALDARAGKLALRGWVEQTAVEVWDLARRLRDGGVERIIYTDISRDGMLRGVAVAETERLAREVGIRVIASGGASSIEDVRQLWARRASGIEGVILGRSLYEKTIDLPILLERVRSWRLIEEPTGGL